MPTSRSGAPDDVTTRPWITPSGGHLHWQSTVSSWPRAQLFLHSKQKRGNLLHGLAYYYERDQVTRDCTLYCPAWQSLISMMYCHLEWFGSNLAIPSWTHSCSDPYHTLEGKLSGTLLDLADPIFLSQLRCSQPNHLCFCPVVGIPTARKYQLFSISAWLCRLTAQWHNISSHVVHRDRPR